MENDVKPRRTSGRPRRNTSVDTFNTTTETNDMIKYYIINKIGPTTVIAKGAPDSVALYLNTKNTEEYIVIKSTSITDKIVPLFNNMSYNNIIKTLENM